MPKGQDAPEHIVAKPIHATSKVQEVRNRDLWARVCYYYPQYDLKSASCLSRRDITLLLHTARRIEAEKLRQLVQIVAAPHTAKGKGVKELLNQYQKEIDS